VKKNSNSSAFKRCLNVVSDWTTRSEDGRELQTRAAAVGNVRTGSGQIAHKTHRIFTDESDYYVQATVCVFVCLVWHYVVQGLFGVGLIVLLIALKTASFHVCCCHCCRDSYAIATVIGSMITIGRTLTFFHYVTRSQAVARIADRTALQQTI